MNRVFGGIFGVLLFGKYFWGILSVAKYFCCLGTPHSVDPYLYVEYCMPNLHSKTSCFIVWFTWLCHFKGYKMISEQNLLSERLYGKVAVWPAMYLNCQPCFHVFRSWSLNVEPTCPLGGCFWRDCWTCLASMCFVWIILSAQYFWSSKLSFDQSFL